MTTEPGEQSSSTSAVPATFASDGFLDDLDQRNIPPGCHLPLRTERELKKEGNDWYAVFKPRVKRVLDVNLMIHERLVC
jgi:glucose repression regulatory protein TUP1